MSLSETFLISPLSVRGCQLWLDAADSTTITAGATITGWTDKSGTSRTVTFSGTNNTYDSTAKSVNTDNATVNYFYANVNLKKSQIQYANVFIVYTWTGSASGGNQALWGQDIGGGWNRFQLLSFTAVPSYAYGLSYTPSSPNATTVSNLNTANRVLYCARYSYQETNGTYARVNGSVASSLVTEAVSPSETSTTNTYFATIDTGYSGRVAFHEIIINTNNLSTADIQKMEGYLAWKWGLTGNLPSTHAYKNSRPLDNIPLPTSLLVPSRPLRNVFVFNPTVLSNCVLWLDGADVSTMFQDTAGALPVRTTGSTVALWRDKSASANHASNTSGQPNVSFAAQNGLNVVNFSGAQYLNLTPSLMPTGSTQYTFFSVIRTTSTNTQVYLTWGDTVNANGFGRAPQLYITNYTLANDTYGAGGTTDTTVYNSVYVLNTNAADSRNNSWDNGSSFNNTNNTAITLNTGTTFAYIGTGQVNGSLYAPFYMIGQIAELVGFSRVLSTAERQQMEGYLAWKWGLQTNLPSTHPQRTNPPDLPAVAPRGISQLKSAFFNPRNISGIQLWLDVADTANRTIAGTTVSQLNDKSGNNYNATQTVSASRPTLATNTLIQFANNTYLDFPQAAINNTTRYALFLIFNPIASVNWILQKQYNGVGSYNMLSMTNYWQNNTGTTNVLYWGPHANTGVVNSSTALTLSALQLIEVLFDGTTLSFYRNGILLNTAVSGPTLTIVNQTSATNCTIGSWRPDGGIQNSGVTNFYFGELVYHNVAFTTGQRQAMEGYLVWKWGLQANLPSSHPFKLFPPSP